MTRLVSILLASALVFCGCGGDDGGTTDTGATDGSMDSSAGDTGGGDTSADTSACGPNTCALCDPACSPFDQCVGGAWVCRCECAEGPPPLPCRGEQEAVRTFIESNKTCVNDVDCVQVGAQCYEAQEDCCVVYMADGYDVAMWQTLNVNLDGCAMPGFGCGCCDAIPADPACNAGLCGPAMR